MARTRAVYKPLTDIDRRAIRAIGGCRYAPRSHQKRLAVRMQRIAAGPTPELTDRQRLALYKQVIHFRTQVGDYGLVNHLYALVRKLEGGTSREENG